MVSIKEELLKQMYRCTICRLVFETWSELTNHYVTTHRLKYQNDSEKYFKNYKSLCKMECACCGAETLPDRELEKTIIYKCKQCSLSDTRLKDTK
jgi:hypothetical protein